MKNIVISSVLMVMLGSGATTVMAQAGPVAQNASGEATTLQASNFVDENEDGICDLVGENSQGDGTCDQTQEQAQTQTRNRNCIQNQTQSQEQAEAQTQDQTQAQTRQRIQTQDNDGECQNECDNENALANQTQSSYSLGNNQ